MKRFLYCLLILPFINFLAFSQGEVKILDYDYSKYPVIENKLFIFDNNGKPELNLSTSSFSIRVNNEPSQHQLNSFDCSQSDITNKLSLTFVFDLGLDNYFHIPTNFSLGKSVLKKLVDLIDTADSEAALTSFDYRSFLNSEFSNSKLKLYDELNNFVSSPGSLLDAAYLNEPAGCFKISDRGLFNKSIIIITDCSGKFNENEVRSRLNGSGAKLFIISLRKEPSAVLHDLCKNSGGWSFAVNNPDEINKIIYSVMAMTKGYKPCTLNWTMDYTCNDKSSVEILVPSKNVFDNFEFTFNNFEKSYITSNPQFLGFSSVEVGNKDTLNIIITAKNKDIFISELKIDHPFKIIKNDVKNYLLKKDEFISVDILYTPEQKALVFSKLEVVSDACSTMPIYITGGFPNTKPTEKTVKILHPNGGEYLIIGDTTFVSWLGLLPKDVIQLEYSTDNGRTWDTLSTNTTGLTKEWIVPDLPSDSCLVKIIQLWPNNVGQTINLKHNKQVNTAFFNREGDLVLTSSDDTTAVVWIANTGVKKFTLVGHSKPVHWAVFDPLDEYVATAAYDSTIIIWNYVDGIIFNTIKHHVARIESINFSKSGKYFISNDAKGNAYIYNRNWEIQKYIKSYDGNLIVYAEFHPLNEDLILCVNRSGIAYEINWKTYQNGDIPPVILDTKSSASSYATYNTDGTKAAVSTWSGSPKKLYVWDLNNIAAPIYEISHNNNSDTNSNNSINYASFFFHPDLNKEVLLTASTDQTARLWDAATGEPEKINDYITDNIFREHNNSVSTAVFDRFGSRVLTSSWDSTAKIWNLNQKELQQDISDSVFTIAYAKGKGVDIDMGTVYLGELKDSIVRAVFINESNFDYQILGSKFSGANSDEFEILTQLSYPYNIKSKDSLPFEIRFFPKDKGLRTSELEFYLPAGIVVKSNLIGNCEETDLKLNYLTTDFGEVVVGSYKDTTLNLVMTNISGKNLEVESIEVAGSYKPDFTSIENVGINLANGESFAVTLRFSPLELGRKNAQYVVKYKGKGSPRLVNLFGEGIDARTDSIEIYVKDAHAKPGDIIDVPIYISLLNGRAISEKINSINTQIKFNATLLEPISGFKSSKIYNDERVLSVDLPTSFSNDSILHVLKFRALWGNDTISPLKVQYSSPNSLGRIFIKEKSAEFKLDGVCIQDGKLRLFIPNGMLSLGQNIPNPAVEKTSITFSLLENANTNISLFDVLGNKIKTLFDGLYTPGTYTVDLDVSNLPQGIYYYIMTTNSSSLRKSMIITK